MTTYRKSMAEALKEVYLGENNLEKMRKASKGAAQTLKMKDGNLKMDSFTASAILQIYDKINDKNKKTFEKMMKDGKKADIMKLQKFAMSKISSEYVPEEFEEEFELDEVTMSKALDIDPKDVDRMKKLAIIMTRAMKLPSGSPKQDKFKKEIEKLRKELGMNESAFKELMKSVELDEAKYDLYHKDFSSAMQHAYAMAKKLYGITIDPKEIDDKVATGPKKQGSGKTNSYRLKGDKGASSEEHTSELQSPCNLVCRLLL